MIRPRRRAFTLVEAIASMVVLAIIGGASAGVMWTAVGSFRDGAESLRLQSEASVAMERLTRHLRAVGLDERSSPELESIGTDAIEWEGGASAVRLRDGRLLLTVGGVESVLCEGVTAFTVSAYDADNAPLSLPRADEACDAVRRVGLEIHLGSEGARTSLRTRVFLRCMALEGVAR
jgi:type II secretory pathway pseudopilin PulG